MKINDIIRTRRQALGLTQEALADKLGVSAPAVNKWERALNYPDITLLPALARTLGVDLNTLLSFQEDMSREETARFLNALAETGRTEGCAAAFQMAQDKLREFPNSGPLASGAAGVLEGILLLYPSGSEAEREGWRQALSALHERSARSTDPQVRETAVHTLISRALAAGDLDRAEALLNQLPQSHPDRPSLTAALREKQGRQEEAWVLLESELFQRAHGIQNILFQMLDLASEEGDRERSRLISDAASQAGAALGLPGCAVLSAPLQRALLERDGPRALALLGDLLESLTTPWSPSPLYRHIPAKPDGKAPAALLQPMLDLLEADPDARFLKDVPGYRALLEKYRSRGT